MLSFFSAVGRILGINQDQPPPANWSTPTYADVCQARAYLKALDLPTELVLQILDHAQYWPQHEFVSNFGHPRIAAAQNGRPSQAVLCLDTDLMDNRIVNDVRRNGETPKIKSVQFGIVSRDQAWTSENTHGTFSTSSWLEVSILRRADQIRDCCHGPPLTAGWLTDPLNYHQDVSSQGWTLVKRPESAKQGPQDGEGDFAWYLQGNRVAVGLDEYCVVWTENGGAGNEGAGSGDGFLQELTEGDRVLVWARAKVGIVYFPAS
jgi:hypothetical protein